MAIRSEGGYTGISDYWLNVEWFLPDGRPVPPGFFEVPPSGRVPYRGEVHATPQEKDPVDQVS